MAASDLKCPECGAPLASLRPLLCLHCGVPLTPADIGSSPSEVTVKRLSKLHERVVADLCQGRAVEDIERWIDETPRLGDDERAALWLYAWTHAKRLSTVRRVDAPQTADTR
jgi:hypothetical protein